MTEVTIKDMVNIMETNENEIQRDENCEYK